MHFMLKMIQNIYILDGGEAGSRGVGSVPCVKAKAGL